MMIQKYMKIYIKYKIDIIHIMSYQITTMIQAMPDNFERPGQRLIRSL